MSEGRRLEPRGGVRTPWRTLLLPLFDADDIGPAIRGVLPARQRVASMPDESLAVVREKERILARITGSSSPLSAWKAAADLWCGFAFRGGSRDVERAALSGARRRDPPGTLIAAGGRRRTLAGRVARGGVGPPVLPLDARVPGGVLLGLGRADRGRRVRRRHRQPAVGHGPRRQRRRRRPRVGPRGCGRPAPLCAVVRRLPGAGGRPRESLPVVRGARLPADARRRTDGPRRPVGARVGCRMRRAAPPPAGPLADRLVDWVREHVRDLPDPPERPLPAHDRIGRRPDRLAAVPAG